ITVGILGIFGRGDSASEFCFKFIAGHQLGCRKQRARSAVLLLELRFFRRLNNVWHADGMNLVARLHDFLLEIKEDFGESRLLFGQSKDSFIDHLKAKRSLYTLSPRVGYAEADARILTRTIDRIFCMRFNLEFVGRLHEYQPMIADRARI